MRPGGGSTVDGERRTWGCQLEPLATTDRGDPKLTNLCASTDSVQYATLVLLRWVFLIMKGKAHRKQGLENRNFGYFPLENLTRRGTSVFPEKTLVEAAGQ